MFQSGNFYIVLFRSYQCGALLLFLLTAFNAAAQTLEADFTIDNQQGCSPLTVSFSNTTKGASAAATYKWDLGRGQMATSLNAGGVYTEERIYTIVLTVTDGTMVSVKSKTVTVYKKPDIQINLQPARGCAPLAVNFTSQVTTDGGVGVSSYVWDYGDGKTDQGILPLPMHVYNNAGTMSVSLTVEDKNGCSATIDKLNSIQVLPPVKAGFTTDRSTSCTAPATIQFTNTSTGPGTLSWQWDFGDGTTSFEKQPVHVYNGKGVFQPKLMVTSSEGCSNSFQMSSGINIASFNLDFSVPSQLCTNQEITFSSTGSPTPANITWAFSDGDAANPHIFRTAGEHTVTMTAAFDNCRIPLEKKITLLPSPVFAGIEALSDGGCGAPVTYTFTDKSEAALRKWTIDGTAAGIAKDTKHTFTINGNHEVKLELTGTEGCSTTGSHLLYLFKPIVRIYYESSTSPEGTSGCEGFTSTFSAISSEAIIAWEWIFSDGGTSNDPKPVHTFGRAGGPYSIRLNYTTVSGCRGTEYMNNIMVYKKPGVDFTMKTANPVCGNSLVEFNATVTGEAENWHWYYKGDYDERAIGTRNGLVRYDQEGVYSVALIAINGTCRDTVRKENLVTVLPPFPRIGEVSNTCQLQRGTVTVKDESRLAETWRWDFGDGSPDLTYNVSRPSVNHDYRATGEYKVVLTITAGNCTVKDSSIVSVLLKQSPVLSLDRGASCASDTLNVFVANQDGSPFGVTTDGDFSVRWQPYVNGAAVDVNGRIWQSAEPDWTKVYIGKLSWLPPGTDSIRAITSTIPFGCRDTTNFVKVKINGPDAAFRINPNGVCLNDPNIFTDRSVLLNNVPPAIWNWDYGDGVTETVTQPSVAHVYETPGNYEVKMKVTDVNGCYDTARYGNATVAGTRAEFVWSPDAVKPNTAISFLNTSISYNTTAVTYTWQFSNDKTSYVGNEAYRPVKTYASTGTDTVMLIARNVGGSCIDTTVKVVYIKNVFAGFSVVTSYINSNGCPPLRAAFTNTSSNYNYIRWDFGDGVTAENLETPVHNYNLPGSYTVWLYAYDREGSVDSFSRKIEVAGPAGSFKAHTALACGAPATITFTADVEDGLDLTWDFGDGTLLHTDKKTVSHTYTQPGVKEAVIVLKDNKGCAVSFKPETPVVIDTLRAAIQTSPAYVCDSATVLFEAQVINIAADQLQLPLNYLWDFGTGKPEDRSTLARPSFFFNRNSPRKVTLQVTSAAGCVYKATADVQFATPVTVNVNDVVICKGSSGSLQATGAQRYKWISGEALSNTAIADPVIKPSASSAYTVVGYDAHGCFTDTATANVMVRALPVVSSIADTTIIAGTSVALLSESSNGIAGYAWTPALYLNCSNCLSPEATPRSAMSYIVTATDVYGCKAKDTVNVGLKCESSSVFIPNTFTPNKDGRNDRFYPRGKGIRQIRYFRIYNRWGELIYERRNFEINDVNQGWDGSLQGNTLSNGLFTYSCEMVCDAGEIFVWKGSVWLVH